MTLKESEEKNRMSNVSKESEELPARLQAVNGVKSGAHAPSMENLI
jgi:hypothetical protein